MSKQRSIFEEVGGAKLARPVAAPGAAEARARRARRGIVAWLAVLFILVVAMIAVGGMTRLTDSGLSITEWRPVTGAIPPLNEAAWAAEFARYQAIPEYQLQNRGMTIEAFKVIYWWEWGHRQLGRVIGLVWAAGFLWFLARRAIPAGWTWRLALPGVLGGMQAVVGWWMVSSGLQGTALDVASTRLAVHLGLAFVILGVLGWSILKLDRDAVGLLQARRLARPGPRAWGGILVAGVFAQVILGALVAGIDAGRGYIDWPLMAGEILPAEAFDVTPLWRNLIENAALVQFNHRVLGYVVAALALAAWIATRGTPLSGIRRAFSWVALGVLGQVALGIVTVMNAAPLALALAHQFGAVVLFTLALRARFEAAYPSDERVARG